MATPIPYPFELLTDRLALRSVSQTDAQQLMEAITESLEQLRPWMPWATSVPDLKQATENCVKAACQFQEGSDHRVHIFCRQSGLLLGSSGLHRADWTVPKVEIGYWIRTSCTGKGYASETVDGLTRYAFGPLGVNRVEILMSSRNLASRRVAERCGFELEGTLRNHCRELDGSLRSTLVWSKIPSSAVAR